MKHILFLGLLSAFVLGQPSFAKQPNILWITAENMGPDLGCYPDSPYAKQVSTPNLDRFAREGMRYRLAFDTSPVCSSSRSAFMTGMYQTSIGAHNHRSHRHDHYQLPADVRPITHRLIEAGYVTANIVSMHGKTVGTGKTDLNFEVTGPVLNPALAAKSKSLDADAGIANRAQNQQNSARLYHTTDWAGLRTRQPFFAQVNLPTVECNPQGWTASARHPWNGQAHPETNDPLRVAPPPYYPDHPISRRHWAGYLDSVGGMDTRVGEILTQLETDGLADDTVVIFFADNGRLEPRGLDWCYDSGDRVPLIVRWPKNFPAPPQYRTGTTSERLVSLIDLTATSLAIAGLPKPTGLHGRVLLGEKAEPEREFVFSARDRTDEAVNRIRSVRSPRFRYVRNFMPKKPFLALHRYKAATFPVVPLLPLLHAQGRLTPPQAALMAPRLPDEELYDLEGDPFEIHNLAASTDPEHQRVLRKMSNALDAWMEETGDQGRTPETAEIIAQWTDAAERQHGDAMRKLATEVKRELEANTGQSRPKQSTSGTNNTVHAAVGLGLARVKQAAAYWQASKTCISCHHQTLPMLAMTEAVRVGFPLDAAWLQSQAKTSHTYLEERIEVMDAGDHVPGGAATAGYGLWALQLAGHLPDVTTTSTVTYLLHIQGVVRLKSVTQSTPAPQREGSWIASCRRPPMQASKFADTALALIGMEKYASAKQRPRVAAARAKAEQWLDRTPLRDQQDRLWRLWGLHQLGGDDATKQEVRDALLAAQNADGGWPEGGERTASDTYTTGQALFMLVKTGLARDHPAIVRARDYLLTRQHADGSWLAETHVKFKAQPYFENGDPFGEHQFLSVAATAWATAGLAQLLPVKP
ncbi:MAG: sulfatase-like hydrolase/transferase [Limisphaerales bacterium]